MAFVFGPKPPADQSPLVVEDVLDDSAKANAWRWNQFINMGFSPEAANSLAASRADWHQVKKARDAGCSRMLVLRIFV